MVGLVIVVAGLSLIFGAKALSSKLLKIALGLVLVLSFLPGLITRVQHGSPSAPGPDVPPVAARILAGAAALAAFGFAAWKLRAWRARAREAARHRHGAPRERDRPRPPLRRGTRR